MRTAVKNTPLEERALAAMACALSREAVLEHDAGDDEVSHYLADRARDCIERSAELEHRRQSRTDADVFAHLQAPAGKCTWCGQKDAPLLPYEGELAHEECIRLLAEAQELMLEKWVRGTRRAA